MSILNIKTLATAILCSVAIFGIAQPPVRDCGTVTDIDGNVYHTVILGDECWLRENLRTTLYADGKAILPTPTVPNSETALIATYGKQVDFVNLDTLEPLVKAL